MTGSTSDTPITPPQLAILGAEVAKLSATLTAELSNLATPSVKRFQNLAIVEVNALVTRIFGTNGTPAPIPPVK